MDPITLNLRVGRLPAASAPVGGELSAAEIDANFTNLKNAADQLAAEKLAAADAVTVGDLVGAAADTDKAIIYRDTTPYLVLRSVFLAGLAAGYSTAAAVRDALATLTGEDRLDAAAIKNLPSGSGSALGLWDYWYYWRIANTSLPSGDMFQAAAIASGTNSAVPSNTLAVGYNSYGAVLSSIASANSGYRYYSINGNEYFSAGGAKKTRFQWTPVTDSATILIYGGWHNTINQNDAADGVYFQINNLTVSCKTAENSSRTTHGTTYTLTLGTPYTFDVDVSADGLSKRFRVYAGTSTTAVMDVTISDSRLTNGTRRTGVSLVAVNTAATAAAMGILHGLGMGTEAAYLRENG